MARDLYRQRGFRSGSLDSTGQLVSQNQTNGSPVGAAPFLEVNNVIKFYGGVRALDGVSLQLREGEVVGLVGDNGAGKSTLLKILSGVVEADHCEFLVRGEESFIRSVSDSNEKGIFTVYQDLALCDNLDVVANLFLGMETSRPFRMGWRLNKPSMQRKAVEVLSALGVKIPSLATQVGRLSGGQRQGVAIARAVLRDPRLVLLDEPTAALGVEQTGQVLDMIRRMRTEGRGVVIVSHNLIDVLSVADRVVVLRLGRVTSIFEKEEIDEERIVAAITGVSARLKDMKSREPLNSGDGQ